MSSATVRRWMGRRAQRIASWLQEGPWRLEAAQQGEWYVRRRPVVFANVDMLQRFLAGMSGQSTDGAHVSVPAVRASWETTNPTAADTIAHLAPGDRTSLTVAGRWSRIEHDPSPLDWTLHMSTRPGAPRVKLYVSSAEPLGRERAEAITGLVDRFTVARRRVPDDTPLVEPVDQETALARAHDAAISRRAVRAGAFWGAVAGVASNVLFEVTKALF